MSVTIEAFVCPSLCHSDVLVFVSVYRQSCNTISDMPICVTHLVVLSDVLVSSSFPCGHWLYVFNTRIRRSTLI